MTHIMNHHLKILKILRGFFIPSNVHFNIVLKTPKNTLKIVGNFFKFHVYWTAVRANVIHEGK